MMLLVMAGLDPAIHVFGDACKEDVDTRDKPGHDEFPWCRLLRQKLPRLDAR
jgi:hypothetical protein